MLYDKFQTLLDRILMNWKKPDEKEVIKLVVEKAMSEHPVQCGLLLVFATFVVAFIFYVVFFIF